VAPLVALIDHHDLGRALAEAFSFPTWFARLAGGVLVPMARAGAPPAVMCVGDARDRMLGATAASLTIGRSIPSGQHQPVMARIHRLRSP
jgi:hypothetical protein